MSTNVASDALAAAVAKIPSGLAVLTATHKGRSTGMLASWVQQASFEPLMLTDRGTYLAFRGKVELAVLVEGDPALHNPYGALLVKPASAAARKLLDYLTSADGQRRIGEFRVAGEQLFHPAALPR